MAQWNIRKKLKGNFWGNVFVFLTPFCTFILAVFTVLSYFYPNDKDISINSYILIKKSGVIDEIEPEAIFVSKTYRKHWSNYKIDPIPSYCLLVVINNSNMSFVNCVIEFSLTIDDSTPLKKFFVGGNITTWGKEIKIIEPGKSKSYTIIDLSPFYSGSLSWRIVADSPYNNNQRITIEENSYKFNNKELLTKSIN